MVESKARELPHKLFAVHTIPVGLMLFRKMWSMRLVGYLSGIGAIAGKGWDAFIESAEVGQVWDMPTENGMRMTLIRIKDDEDRGDTA